MSTDQSSEFPIWTPTAERIAGSRIHHYMEWLKAERGLGFADYKALWQWSVDDLEGFWSSLWDYFEIKARQPYRQVLAQRVVQGAQWFAGSELNFVDHVFRNARTDKPAIVHASETSGLLSLSWAELQEQVASMAAHLRSLGISRGDRVGAYVPNTPEAIVAFLATASIGAIWSICSPDMGSRAVLDRFRQIEPKALFAVTSYRYGGKAHDRQDVVSTFAGELPSLRHIILLPGPMGPEPSEQFLTTSPAHVAVSRWTDGLGNAAPLIVESVPFDHPIWVVYSSGTTGLPKAIVHGHGGVLLEILKVLAFHNDLGPSDVFHWYSSTNWVMWNIQLSGLLLGATAAIYDGNPGWPDASALWRFAGAAKVTFFGAGAAFYAGCQKAQVRPRTVGEFAQLRTIGSTGSPLSPESYAWIYAELGPDVWLTPMSGGTDFCSAFVGGVPILPVFPGEMQCRCLGADVHAYDDAGHDLIDAVGELVCASPMPSMPLYLWNDPDGSRYHHSYFDTYPGIWRHGDWIRITPRGGAVIYGRSDATINRFGLRLGTSEIYRAVEELPEVLDSLVIDMEYLGRDSYMPLFVVLRPGLELDQALKDRINQAIRSAVSPRFLPNEIFQVPEVPRTMTGKKLEVPVKKIFLGQPPEKVVNPGALASQGSMNWYVEFARGLPKAGDAA